MVLIFISINKKCIKNYEISYLIKPYKSFMPTEFSHDKVLITLDYIIINKEKFKFMSVECIDNNISDHNPVIAEIKIIDNQLP